MTAPNVVAPHAAAAAALPASMRAPRPTRGRSALETIGRLRLTAAVPLPGRLGRPLDAEQEAAPFAAKFDALRARAAGRVARAPTGATLDRALARWAECRPDVGALGPRYVRALCTHPPAVRDAAFVAGVAAHPELLRRRRWVESLVDVYEAEWRPPGTAEALERLLRAAVAGAAFRSARLDKLRPVAARHFSPDAARASADAALRAEAAVTAALAQYGVAADSALARAAVAAGAALWAERLTAQRDAAAARPLLEYGLARLLPPNVLQTAPLNQAMGRVIEWLPERDERAMATLRDWLLDDARFGDPRLPANQSKWATLSPAARERMIRWLAKGDLLFFFDFVMAGTTDYHGRKDFWLRYIDQVEDSTVALSEYDARRLTLSVTDRLRYARVEGGYTASSAFLMRFRGASNLTVIEFSRVNNAVHFHDSDHFDKGHGGLRARTYHEKQDLKASVLWYPHTSRWTENVEHFLLRRDVRRGPR